MCSQLLHFLSTPRPPGKKCCSGRCAWRMVASPRPIQVAPNFPPQFGLLPTRPSSLHSRRSSDFPLISRGHQRDWGLGSPRWWGSRDRGARPLAPHPSGGPRRLRPFWGLMSRLYVPHASRDGGSLTRRSAGNVCCCCCAGTLAVNKARTRLAQQMTPRHDTPALQEGDVLIRDNWGAPGVI